MNIKSVVESFVRRFGEVGCRQRLQEAGETGGGRNSQQQSCPHTSVPQISRISRGSPCGEHSIKELPREPIQTRDAAKTVGTGAMSPNTSLHQACYRVRVWPCVPAACDSRTRGSNRRACGPPLSGGLRSHETNS